MDITKTILPIINSKVVSSKSGGSVGSLWLIDFENGCSFYIYCAWRIEHDNQVIASNNDDSTAITGLITNSVKKLENKKLISFSLTEQYDMTLIFEDNYCVKVFCNVSYSATENGDDYDTNWDFCIPNQNLVISVSNYFNVRTDSYHDNDQNVTIAN